MKFIKFIKYNNSLTETENLQILLATPEAKKATGVAMMRRDGWIRHLYIAKNGYTIKNDGVSVEIAESSVIKKIMVGNWGGPVRWGCFGTQRGPNVYNVMRTYKFAKEEIGRDYWKHSSKKYRFINQYYRI